MGTNKELSFSIFDEKASIKSLFNRYVLQLRGEKNVNRCFRLGGFTTYPQNFDTK